MNWFRILLDGIVLSAVFNITIALGWVIRPHGLYGHVPPCDPAHRAEDDKRGSAI